MVKRLVAPDDLSSMVWTMYYDSDNSHLYVTFAVNSKVDGKTNRKPGKTCKYPFVPQGYADALEAEAQKVDGSVGSLLSELITHKSVRDLFPFEYLDVLPDFMQTEVNELDGKTG